MKEEFLMNRDKLDHRNPERAVLKAPEGLTEETVRLISKDKNEPEWMLQKRLQAYKHFIERPMPNWGPSLEKLNLDKITYYIKPNEQGYARSWEEVPEGIKEGSLEHALIQFFGCNLDSMRSADYVYQAVRDMAFDSDLSKLHELPRQELIELFKKHFESDPEKTMGNPLATTIFNSRKLFNEYGGDPRNLVARTINGTINRILEFKQYGPGKAALLLKNFVRFGIAPFPKTSIPIKVDRHAIRISLGYGALQVSEGTETIRADKACKILTRTYQKITRREKLSAIALNDGFWAIGSRCCRYNNDIYCKTSCPINCQTRPESDQNATWFYPQTDKRKNQDNLWRIKSRT